MAKSTHMFKDTINLLKNDPGILVSAEEVDYSSKTTKIVIIALHVVFASILIASVVLVAYASREPVINVSDNSVQIKALYGLSMDFADIADISLIEKSMRIIGVGQRKGGISHAAGVLKGYFESDALGKTLLFVQSDSSPTIQIKRKRSGMRDVYIRFPDSSKTRKLYDEMMEAFTRR
jgi:hypothetical protein